MSTSPSTRPDLPDRRTHAWRDDLAVAELRGLVPAARFVETDEAQIVWPLAPLRQRPERLAALDTEVLFGERVDVIEVAEGWAWVQARRDRYVGYLPSAALSPTLTAPTHRVQALATFVYPHPDIKAPPTMALSLGSEITVTAADERFAELAGGGFVIGRHISEVGRYASDFVDVAERFIGSPYLWGGRTRNGIDCSGLVQVSLEAAGLAAPRDSDMQEATLGQTMLVPEGLEGLDRGDLVFWPGHVGIMVDGVMMLHANAHHMAVAVEPLSGAADRIARGGSRISAIKRLPGLSAASV